MLRSKDCLWITSSILFIQHCIPYFFKFICIPRVLPHLTIDREFFEVYFPLVYGVYLRMYDHASYASEIRDRSPLLV